jgi:hypothetical protein
LKFASVSFYCQVSDTGSVRCFLPSLAPFGQAVSEEKIFLTLANQKQELPLAAIFVGGMGIRDRR